MKSSEFWAYLFYMGAIPVFIHFISFEIIMTTLVSISTWQLLVLRLRSDKQKRKNERV